MLGEAYLSFLGLGVPPPSSSIGVLAQEGAAAIALRPVLLIAPAVVFAALLYGLTQISEILREILGYEPEGANLW
jgi:ABC-type dipeptide/oligopeptide/nickel transport system permease subunit